MNSPQQRKGMHAKIAIARKQLDLDDDTYREKLRNDFAVSSSKDLNVHQLARLVQSLAALADSGDEGGRNLFPPTCYRVEAGKSPARVPRV